MPPRSIKFPTSLPVSITTVVSPVVLCPTVAPAVCPVGGVLGGVIWTSILPSVPIITSLFHPSNNPPTKNSKPASMAPATFSPPFCITSPTLVFKTPGTTVSIMSSAISPAFCTTLGGVNPPCLGTQ